MATTTTIKIAFSDPTAAAAAGAHLSCELDNRETGLNLGTSSFVPGDTAWFLVYMSSNVELDGLPVASAGSIGTAPNLTITRVEELIFENTDSATLSVPAMSVSSVQWLGRDLGALTLQGDSMTLKAPTKGVAVAEVTYTATCTPFSIASPKTLNGKTTFSICVYVLGKLI